MIDLIPLINKLQDLFNETGATGLKEIQLPQIVVIGIQVNKYNIFMLFYSKHTLHANSINFSFYFFYQNF